MRKNEPRYRCGFALLDRKVITCKNLRDDRLHHFDKLRTFMLGMPQRAGRNAAKQGKQHLRPQNRRCNSGILQDATKLFPYFTIIVLQDLGNRRISLRLGKNLEIQNRSERILMLDNNVDDEWSDNSRSTTASINKSLDAK